MFTAARFTVSQTVNAPDAPRKVASGRTAMPGHRGPGRQEELAINMVRDKDASQNNCTGRRTGGMVYDSRCTDIQETQANMRCSGPQVGRLATDGLSREAGWREDRAQQHRPAMLHIGMFILLIVGTFPQTHACRNSVDCPL